MPGSIDSEEARLVRKYLYLSVNSIIIVFGVPTLIFLLFTLVYSICMMKKSQKGSFGRASVQKRDGFAFKMYVLACCIISIALEVVNRIFQISIPSFDSSYVWKIAYSLNIVSNSLYALATFRIILFGIQLTVTILKQGFMRSSRLIFSVSVGVSIAIQTIAGIIVIILSCIFCKTRYQYIIVRDVFTLAFCCILGLALLALIIIFYRYSKKMPKSKSLVRLMILSIIVCLSFFGLFYAYFGQFIVSILADKVKYVKFMLPLLDFGAIIFVYIIPIIVIGLFVFSGSRNLYSKSSKRLSRKVSSNSMNLTQGLMDSDYRPLQEEVQQQNN